jgi:lipid-A-disaccharide synthase
VDLCLVILPFEERFLAERGVAARYVGHPLGREVRRPRDRAGFLRGLGLDPATDVVALLPGSRPQELEALAVTFLEAGLRARTRAPRPLAPIFGVATPELGRRLRALVGDGLTVAVDRTSDLLAASAAAITKAGTVTVEAALLGTPIVVAYRMRPLTLWVARRLVRVEHVAMVNILRGRPVVPELLQEQATPERLADHALRLAEPASPERRAMLAEFDALRGELLRRDAPAEVAAAVRSVLALEDP